MAIILLTTIYNAKINDLRIYIENGFEANKKVVGCIEWNMLASTFDNKDARKIYICIKKLPQ